MGRSHYYRMGSWGVITVKIMLNKYRSISITINVNPSKASALLVWGISLSKILARSLGRPRGSFFTGEKAKCGQGNNTSFEFGCVGGRDGSKVGGVETKRGAL